MGDKLRTKDEHTKIIKIRKWKKDILYGGDAENLLLPIEFSSGRRIPWRAPVSLITVLNKNGDTASTDEEMKTLICGINLDSSLKTILTDLEATIKNFKIFKGNPQGNRLSIETLTRDMEIYTLIYDKKKDKSDIAEKFFPEQFERNRHTAIQEVKRSLDRIESLIKEKDNI